MQAGTQARRRDFDHDWPWVDVPRAFIFSLSLLVCVACYTPPPPLPPRSSAGLEEDAARMQHVLLYCMYVFLLVVCGVVPSFFFLLRLLPTRTNYSMVNNECSLLGSSPSFTSSVSPTCV